MKREEFNTAFRQHAKERLSPTEVERQTVSAIYQSLQDVLGTNSCLQIGSYPRFTAITPLHDLDVLYILGQWKPEAHDPSSALESLHKTLSASFKNPTKWRIEIARQTHSITIRFLQGDEEKLSVDVVPAYISGRNEFGGDMYVVPEIARRGHAARAREYQSLAATRGQMQWIKTDPRGYIEVARLTNDANSDFRKTVKLVKAWHYSCKEAFDSKLKSFHIEQVLTGYFRESETDIFGAVYRFFVDLPDTIRKPQIPDRADSTKFIDEYVGTLGLPERRSIIEARDGFLIKLENFQPGQSVASLLKAEMRERKSASEAYLFDRGIPVLTDRPIAIVGEVQPRAGFRAFILDALGLIEIDRRISFRLKTPLDEPTLYKWKVKNDDSSPQPRGEITDHRTLNDPEATSYNGNHYVECFAIKNGICVAKARQAVKLARKI